ncbi:MAG: hypothetical protein IJN91_04235 [Alphaproteobacteria bacterium]|nr:hypothetical protein [Alphaproteobacteria bacterium]
MKRLLTAGIFGTILGIVNTGTANASIVSSGFLDEKLTEYALSTSLDLKANQSDFTELNTQINHACNSVRSGFYDLNYQFSTYEPESDFPKNIAEIGDAISMTMDIIGSKMLDGWTDPYSSKIYRGLRSLNDGWKDTDGTTYLGVKDLNTKIGTLPEGITVQGMFVGWTDRGGNYHPGLSIFSKNESLLLNAYDSGSATLLIQGATSTTIDGVEYTGPVYPLWKLSEGIDKIGSIETKIGDLPTEIPHMNILWEKYGFAERGTPIDLPDTIGGMFAMLFNEDESYNGLSLGNIMTKILIGFSSSSNVRFEGLSSLTSVYKLVGDSPIVTAVKANTAKIGTVPDGKNLAGMIGTLPDGYDSVGAALTAIKGIAEDAKAAALAAIPDPKQEGSSGKFVLTVDIVGDNATYHWEKIDREGETTTE